jgi:hypothetical protein
MTRPDEIAALANEDELADFIYQVQDYSHAKRKAAMLWPLVRLSATSPGDGARDVLHEFDVHQYVSDYEFRADQDYKPNEHEQAILEDAINGVISGIEAALAPAEKAGDDPLDDLVARFSAALLAKLKDAREKYGYADEGWQYDDWRLSCREQLLKHLAKGDPRDVAAYCAFMWHHGWSTVAATPTPPSVDVVKVGKTKCHWCSGKGTRELGVGAAVVCGRCGGAKYDELIQSAAQGGGTKSDGEPGNGKQPTMASRQSPPGPSDPPAQEAVALLHTEIDQIIKKIMHANYSDKPRLELAIGRAIERANTHPLELLSYYGITRERPPAQESATEDNRCVKLEDALRQAIDYIKDGCPEDSYSFVMMEAKVALNERGWDTSLAGRQ